MKTPRSFRPVAKQMTDAVIITDEKGLIDWINPACTRLCGYTLKEMKGRKPGALLQGPQTDPKAVRALRNAIHRGRKIYVELINYHKDKRPYAVWISLTPIKDRAGKISGFIAIERETTVLQNELRKLENEMAELYGIICKMTEEKSA